MTLQREYTKLMRKMEAPAFYRRVFMRAMDRSNSVAQAIASNPPSGSKLAKFLTTMNKTRKAQFLTGWKPFRMGSPARIQKMQVSLTAETDMASYNYLDDAHNASVEELITDATITELMADADTWINIVMQDLIKGGGAHRLDTARQSGTK